MSQSRQLAAIMFTDIVGYSAIMQQDESAAVEKINRFREILENHVNNYNGKIIQYYGDGCLLLFNSSVDAVGFAKKLQEEFSASSLPVRTGIHIGDVLLKDGNVFGDTVNIASRIQAFAPAGAILISEAVQKNIVNKPDFSTEFLKSEKLKNIKDPFRIYSVATEGSAITVADLVEPGNNKGKLNRSLLFIFLGILIASVAGYFVYNKLQPEKKEVPLSDTIDAEINSIAVLPFTDNSATKDQEYLGDGIAEEILNVLYSTMKDLRVPGRSSCFAFKGKGMNLKEIGKILNVKNILEGSVQKSGDKVNVKVFLNDAEDGHQIWIEQYNRPLKDIFSIQNEIAEKVGEKLKLTLFENNVSNESLTVNAEAYELVLKGNYYFNKGSDGFREAATYHKKAIAIDPDYAYPYIRLGWAIYQMTLYGQYPPKTGFAMAKKELEKALKLKLTASDKHSAHSVLSYINLWGYNWGHARAEYDKANAINPKQNDFNAFYHSLVLGKTVEGVSIFKKVSDENPVDFLKSRDLATLQYLARQYDDAMQTCNKILELNPTFSEAYRIKGHIFSAQNKPDSALIYFNKAAELGNQWGKLLTITMLPQVLKKEEAKKVFSMADSLNPAAIPAIARALIYQSFGETDKAFVWLNKAYEQKDFWLASLRVDPIWDSMRSDTRFVKLFKKMNFPE